MITLFALIIGHALCDYPLQGDSMARGKNRNIPPQNIPPGQKVCTVWPYWLTAHALIHAGAVWLITGNAFIAFVEFVWHWNIDLLKCDNRTNIHVDQALHIACKILYAVALA